MQAPSDTLNIAVVGVGGMGRANTMAVLSQNIVAFCDVHDSLMANTIKQIETAAAAAGSNVQRGGGTARAAQRRL